MEGTAKRGDQDTYRFESKHDQWLTIGCSQVTPGKRFAVTLYQLGAGGRKVEVDRSEGVAGPAGIHTRVPRGRYQVVVEQIAGDPTKPELTTHPVGKRLGPALMRQRAAFGRVFPESVDRTSEQDPDRYRVYVSGSGPVDPSALVQPTRTEMAQALASSAIQEQILEQSVVTLEAAVRSLETFDRLVASVTPPPVIAFFRLWGVSPLVRPADDTSDPRKAQDPTIERFMRTVSRLDHMFYGGKTADWIQAWMPAWLAPLREVDRELRSHGLPGLPFPSTVANHTDR